MKVQTPQGVRQVIPGEVRMGRAPKEMWDKATRSQAGKSGLRDARGLQGGALTRANDPANVVAEMMFAAFSGQPHIDVKRGPDVGSSSVKTVFDGRRRLQSPEYHLHNGVESLVLIRYDHDTGEFFYRGWISVDDFKYNAIESDGGDNSRPPILRLENRYLQSGLPPYEV